MKQLALNRTPETAPEETARESLKRTLAPAFLCAETSSSLIASRHVVRLRGHTYEIPKLLLLGQRGGGEPIRLGIFAGFEPGQIEIVTALTALLLDLEASPARARDYALFGYPVVNLRAFDETPTPLSDFERRFAKDSADEDVQFFKLELRRWFFNGLITLQTDPNASGLYASVRSEIIAGQVIKPALAEAGAVVPLDGRPIRVRPADRYARAADYADGRLVPPADIRPYPFEVKLAVPAGPASAAIASIGASVKAILRNYRRFIAHGANL
jgi:hypothetical protein